MQVSEKKHILVLTPGFPKDESDVNCIPPLQIFIENFYASFNDYKISIISLHYPSVKSKYVWNNIDVYSCGGNDISFPGRINIWKVAMNYANQINRQFPLIGVHSFWLGECAFLAHRISYKFKISHINTLMGQELNGTNRYLSFINFKKLKVVALTDKQADAFSNRAGKAVDKIIPWGIRDDEKVINHDREIDLIGAGSLIAGKNFELFIEILHVIKKRFPDINAVIAGDGIEKEKLSKLISIYKLENNLQLTGDLKRNEVLKLMSKSKIFLHTSKYESFGYALAEGLASGCYVVCSNTGFAHNTKKMFIANENNDYINIILDLLNNKLDFMPEVEYSVADTSNMYKNLYEAYFRIKLS